MRIDRAHTIVDEASTRSQRARRPLGDELVRVSVDEELEGSNEPSPRGVFVPYARGTIASRPPTSPHEDS